MYAYLLPSDRLGYTFDKSLRPFALKKNIIGYRTERETRIIIFQVDLPQVNE